MPVIAGHVEQGTTRAHAASIASIIAQKGFSSPDNFLIPAEVLQPVGKNNREDVKDAKGIKVSFAFFQSSW
jgi:hypothetical protein